MAQKLQTVPTALTAATTEVNDRLAQARSQKSAVEADLREAYFFTRPRLSRQVSSTAQPSTTLNRDVDELATGLGAEVSEDFATEVISAFFPIGQKWVTSTAEQAIVNGATKDDLQQLESAIDAYDRKVFASISASNFNSELAVALDPDASIGTIGLWVDAPGAGRPYEVEHVPARELEVNVDPKGNVGDRFRVRFVKPAGLRALIGADVVLPKNIENKIATRQSGMIEVVWAFWRDWSQPENDIYQHVLMVDKVAVHQTTLEGEGCLPLIVSRFSPDKLHSWGNGPAIKALQELRVLDTITAATQDACDIALQPPMGYPDDGVVNFEGGLESGKAYPMRPGSGRDFVSLAFQGDPNLGYYTATDLERRVKRKFFADYPEQKGDTPPTATQWTDEMVRSQRRIGTPGAKFWREGPYEIYRRFEWLLTKDGKLEQAEFKGAKLSLTANNPATQAQDNQKLQVAVQLLNIIKSYFPQTSQAAIDEMGTIENMQGLVKDAVIKLRSKEEAAGLIKNILTAAQSLGTGGSGAPPAAAAGAINGNG